VPKEKLVIDGSGLILGRLASKVAKFLLEGYEVSVINIEKVVVSGKRDSIFKEHEKFLEIKSKVNPKYTPRHYRRPDNMFRATVRGMLPRKKPKGKVAFGRLKVFIGSPGNVKGKKVEIPEASSERLKSSFITLGELAARFGWKGV
jgi:large subunit ribosomal protein L13